MAYHKCASIYGTNNSTASVQTASGAIANFNTQLCIPFVSIKAYINAIQEAGTPTPQSPKAISGVSEINVVNQSENAEVFRGLLLGTYGFINLGSLTWGNASNGRVSCGNLPSDIKLVVNPGTKGNIICSIYANDTQNNVYNRVTNKIIAVTNNSSAKLLVYDSNLGNKTNTEVKNSMQGTYLIYELETPKTPTITKAQFETLCQAFDITGNTYTIQLGDTYYGGYVSQDKNGKRELVVTHSRVDLGSINWEYDSVRGSFSAVTKLNDAKNPVSVSYPFNGKCEVYTIDSSYNTEHSINDNAISLSSSKYLRIVDTNAGTDATAFKTALSGHYLIYELAEPITIDLPDGTPINTLSGVNNVYADSGDIEVAYRKIV